MGRGDDEEMRLPTRSERAGVTQDEEVEREKAGWMRRDSREESLDPVVKDRSTAVLREN